MQQVKTGVPDEDELTKQEKEKIDFFLEERRKELVKEAVAKHAREQAKKDSSLAAAAAEASSKASSSNTKSENTNSNTNNSKNKSASAGSGSNGGGESNGGDDKKNGIVNVKQSTTTITARRARMVMRRIPPLRGPGHQSRHRQR